MIFTRKDKYYETSKEGYTICMTGAGDNILFTAWYKNESLNNFNDIDDARNYCQEHYELST